MSKKIFIFSVIMFILAGTILVFLKIDSNKTIEVSNQEMAKEKELLEKKENIERADQKIIKLIEGNVRGVFLNKSERKLIYCNGSNFLESDLDGEMKRSLAAHPFNEIQEIIWSKDGKKAIVKDNNDFLIVFLEENKTEKLKDGMDKVIFDFSGDNLIYKYYQSSDQKRSINISNLDGNNWEELVKVEFKDVVLASHPFNNSFLFYPQSRALNSSSLILFNIREKQEKEIFNGKYGADYLWSPNGNKILVSFTLENDKSKLSLGIMNADGGEFRGLNFPTSIKKCIWSNDNKNVYCAMMNNFPTQAILPDDWEEKKFYSMDTFWKVNTNTGEKERVLNPEELNEELDVSNLLLDSEEKYLFMINRKNGDVYRINL
jgi:hypothetical protein